MLPNGALRLVTEVEVEDGATRLWIDAEAIGFWTRASEVDRAG